MKPKVGSLKTSKIDKPLVRLIKKKRQKVLFLVFCFFVCLFLVFLGPYPWHMEVPWLGVKSELQLLVYTTATATPDPSCICSLHHSSQPRWILNPLSKVRGQTCVLMDASQILFH